LHLLQGGDRAGVEGAVDVEVRRRGDLGGGEDGLDPPLDQHHLRADRPLLVLAQPAATGVVRHQPTLPKVRPSSSTSSPDAWFAWLVSRYSWRLRAQRPASASVMGRDWPVVGSTYSSSSA